MDKIIHLPPSRGVVPEGLLADDELAGLEVARARIALCGLRDILEGMMPGSTCDAAQMGALIDCIASAFPEDDDP